jgi:hypothetical protein
VMLVSAAVLGGGRSRGPTDGCGFFGIAGDRWKRISSVDHGEVSTAVMSAHGRGRRDGVRDRGGRVAVREPTAPGGAPLPRSAGRAVYVHKKADMDRGTARRSRCGLVAGTVTSGDATRCCLLGTSPLRVGRKRQLRRVTSRSPPSVATCRATAHSDRPSSAPRPSPWPGRKVIAAVLMTSGAVPGVGGCLLGQWRGEPASDSGMVMGSRRSRSFT